VHVHEDERVRVHVFSKGVIGDVDDRIDRDDGNDDDARSSRSCIIL
jgi:hypothetical protein